MDVLNDYSLILSSFEQGSKEVVPNDRIKIEQLDDEFVLICKAAEKGDQGRYAITLRNPKGSDTAHVNLIVLDKPAAPEGPLEASKITPDSCKLAWNPPKVSGIVVVVNKSEVTW